MSSPHGSRPATRDASHAESWPFAWDRKLAAYQLLRRELGKDPVLGLDGDLILCGDQLAVETAAFDARRGAAD